MINQIQEETGAGEAVCLNNKKSQLKMVSSNNMFFDDLRT